MVSGRYLLRNWPSAAPKDASPQLSRWVVSNSTFDSKTSQSVTPVVVTCHRWGGRFVTRPPGVVRCNLSLAICLRRRRPLFIVARRRQEVWQTVLFADCRSAAMSRYSHSLRLKLLLSNLTKNVNVSRQFAPKAVMHFTVYSTLYSGWSSEGHLSYFGASQWPISEQNSTYVANSKVSTMKGDYVGLLF